MPVFTVLDERGSEQYVGYEAEDVFDLAAPMIQKALRYAHGEINIYTIKHSILEGKMQLWVVRDKGEIANVTVTAIDQYPLKRVVRIVTSAGQIAPFLDTFEQIKLWAAMNGAVELEAYCRPAMTRLLKRYGYEKVYDVVRLDLRRKLQ